MGVDLSRPDQSMSQSWRCWAWAVRNVRWVEPYTYFHARIPYVVQYWNSQCWVHWRAERSGGPDLDGLMEVGLLVGVKSGCGDGVVLVVAGSSGSCSRVDIGRNSNFLLAGWVAVKVATKQVEAKLSLRDGLAEVETSSWDLPQSWRRDRDCGSHGLAQHQRCCMGALQSSCV